MKRDERQVKLLNSLFQCAAIFSLLFLMVADGKAADPGADYPSRPIELVAHSGPGSSNDVMGRVITEIIAKRNILSQSMSVVNKVGSGGAVAQGYVFERKGNPHILHIISSATFLCTPLLEKLPYTYKSFVPIANMAADGNVLVVRSDSPFKTIGDLIAEAKKRPKGLIQGGGSFTSSDSMMGQSIQKLKGVQWNFISFKTSAEALLSVLSGDVHFGFANPQPILDHVRTGKMRVLLAGAPNRYPEFKDAPTMKEAGYGEPIVTYRGIVGPPNIPDSVVKKLEAVFKKVMDDDQFKKYLADTMMQPAWMSTQEYSKFLDVENDRWKALLTEVDLLKKK